MRTIWQKFGLIALGIVIGAAALGAVWASSDGGGSGGEARVVVERLESGNLEVGIQQRHADGEWGDTLKPENRYLRPDVEVGKPIYSSAVALDGRAEIMADEYEAYMRGVGFGTWLNSRNERNEVEQPGTLLCINDPVDLSVNVMCEEAENEYEGETVQIHFSDWDDLEAQLIPHMADENVTNIVALNLPITAFTADVREAQGRAFENLPISYWIELVNQLNAPHDELFCLITHSGHAIADWAGTDLFWGLSSEVATAAAGQMGIELAFSSHVDSADQADAIRECIDEGAVAIATSLADPTTLAPAIAEANAAGVPVVTFNSGAEQAAASGSALHIGLDDFEAGRLVGAELTARGIDGKILCVVHEANNVGLHDRCNGIEDTYAGEVEHWSPEDASKSHREVAERIGEGDIAVIAALSTDETYFATWSRGEAEVDVDIVGFGYSVRLMDQVIAGDVLFAVLDHPELQAYMAAVANVVTERWRLDPKAYFNGLNLLIEPQIADADYMQSLRDSMLD